MSQDKEETVVRVSRFGGQVVIEDDIGIVVMAGGFPGQNLEEIFWLDEAAFDSPPIADQMEIAHVTDTGLEIEAHPLEQT